MPMCWECSGLNFNYSYFIFGMVVALYSLFNMIISFAMIVIFNFWQIFYVVNITFMFL